MDYIQDALRRQKTLWQALLLGGTGPGSREEEPEAAPSRRVTAGRETAERPSPRLRTEEAEDSGLRHRLERQSGRERRRAAAALGLAPEEDPGRGPSPAGSGPMAQETPQRPGTLPDSLSLTFQRDARRYDGAFPAY